MYRAVRVPATEAFTLMRSFLHALLQSNRRDLGVNAPSFFFSTPSLCGFAAVTRSSLALPSITLKQTRAGDDSTSGSERNDEFQG
jgi:hypothetical protein